VENFVRNKAIARQYHTWFTWDARNANNFFGLFGAQFKAIMTQRVTASEELQSSVKAFLELGAERNRLVHENFATFQMEKTLQEIYALYNLANKFVDALPKAFRDSDTETNNEHDSSDTLSKMSKSCG
jgi:methionyl-tRNA synthetase